MNTKTERVIPAQHGLINRSVLRLVCAAAMAAFLAGLSACGSSSDIVSVQNSILGSWNCSHGGGVEFFPNGTFKETDGYGTELNGNYQIVIWTFSGGDLPDATYPVINKMYTQWQWSPETVAGFNQLDVVNGNPVGTIANQTPSVDRADAIVSVNGDQAVFSQLDYGGPDTTPGLELDPTHYRYIPNNNQTCTR